MEDFDQIRNRGGTAKPILFKQLKTSGEDRGGLGESVHIISVLPRKIQLSRKMFATDDRFRLRGSDGKDLGQEPRDCWRSQGRTQKACSQRLVPFPKGLIVEQMLATDDQTQGRGGVTTTNSPKQPGKIRGCLRALTNLVPILWARWEMFQESIKIIDTQNNFVEAATTIIPPVKLRNAGEGRGTPGKLVHNFWEPRNKFEKNFLWPAGKRGGGRGKRRQQISPNNLGISGHAREHSASLYSISGRCGRRFRYR